MLELRGPAHIGQTPPPHVRGALPGAGVPYQRETAALRGRERDGLADCGLARGRRWKVSDSKIKSFQQYIDTARLQGVMSAS
jgi:hypothetical protein